LGKVGAGLRAAPAPAAAADRARCQPVYETLPGWQSDTVGITAYDQLPEKARALPGGSPPTTRHMRSGGCECPVEAKEPT